MTSVYLGLVLALVIKDVCVVCIACYLVNALLFFFVLRDYRRFAAALRGSRSSEMRPRSDAAE